MSETLTEISVPPTWKRGQSLKLKLTDGREVAIKVPDDAANRAIAMA